jgi:hypothetical protein
MDHLNDISFNYFGDVFIREDGAWFGPILRMRFLSNGRIYGLFHGSVRIDNPDSIRNLNYMSRNLTNGIFFSWPEINWKIPKTA